MSIRITFLAVGTIPALTSITGLGLTAALYLRVANSIPTRLIFIGSLQATKVVDRELEMPLKHRTYFRIPRGLKSILQQPRVTRTMPLDIFLDVAEHLHSRSDLLNFALTVCTFDVLYNSY